MVLKSFKIFGGTNLEQFRAVSLGEIALAVIEDHLTY